VGACHVRAAEPEDYAALPVIDMLSLSPSGKYYAFRKTESGQSFALIVKRESQEVLWAAELGDANLEDLYFLTDNFVIMRAFEFTRIEGYRGEYDVSTAYALDIKERKLRRLLTLGDRISEAQTGLGEIIGISPDQKYVYMPAFTGGNGEGLSRFKYKRAIMKVNLKKPKNPRSIFSGDEDSYDLFIDGVGNPLIQVVMDNDQNKYSINHLARKKPHRIYEYEGERPPFSIGGLSSDLQSLVVLDENEESGRFDYYQLSLADGSLNNMGIGRNDADIEGIITDTNRVVKGVRYSGFTPGYYFFDETLNQRITDIVDMFPGHSVWVIDVSENDEHILFKVEGSQLSGDYFISSNGEEPQFIASSRPDIQSDAIHPIAKTTITATDGLKIPVLLTIPKRVIKQFSNLPTIVIPHGGPASYDRIGFDWMAQTLANAGYLIVQPQFRGSTGFGYNHLFAGKGEWGKKMQQDITDTLDGLINKGYIDKDRICIAGASYGGYAALAGGALTPDLFQCVVSLNGISDLTMMLRSERKDHGSDSWVVDYWEDQMAGENTESVDLDRISPAFYANRFKAPVLLLHSENDETVKYAQSKHMEKQLKKAGKQVKLVKLEDDNHDLLELSSRLTVIQHMLDFVNSNIGHLNQ